MPKAQVPADVEIAALKKKVVQQGNLMQAGSGTPWEDRGSLGILKAFLVTCFKSLVSPGQLWEQIRRPETTSDATIFALWCGAIAGISWVIHSLAWDLVYSGYGNGTSDGVPPLLVKDKPNYTVDWQTWWIGSALQLACAILGTVLMLRLANLIYQKLLPHGIASRIPSALSYNILAYALGCVLLALIPCFGWAVALVWLLGLFIFAGTRRLHLGAGTGVVSGILTFIVVVVLGFSIYFAGGFGWSTVMGSAVTYTPPIKSPVAP